MNTSRNFGFTRPAKKQVRLPDLGAKVIGANPIQSET